MTSSRCHKQDIWLELFFFCFFLISSFEGHGQLVFWLYTFQAPFFYYFSFFFWINIDSFRNTHAKYIEAKRGPVFSLTETKIDATLQTGTFSFSLFILILNSLLYPPLSLILSPVMLAALTRRYHYTFVFFLLDPNRRLPFSVNYQSTTPFFFFIIWSWVEGGKQQQ
ncbi:hypothetical protein GGI42DRAFT_240536 [Trichoderma sp. SZMC 28013]